MIPPLIDLIRCDSADPVPVSVSDFFTGPIFAWLYADIFLHLSIQRLKHSA